MPRLRESGTEMLEQAFEAYRDALKKIHEGRRTVPAQHRAQRF
jgi:hypothetical protein